MGTRLGALQGQKKNVSWEESTLEASNPGLEGLEVPTMSWVKGWGKRGSSQKNSDSPARMSSQGSKLSLLTVPFELH